MFKVDALGDYHTAKHIGEYGDPYDFYIPWCDECREELFELDEMIADARAKYESVKDRKRNQNLQIISLPTISYKDAVRLLGYKPLSNNIKTIFADDDFVYLLCHNKTDYSEGALVMRHKRNNR